MRPILIYTSETLGHQQGNWMNPFGEGIFFFFGPVFRVRIRKLSYEQRIRRTLTGDRHFFSYLRKGNKIEKDGPRRRETRD